MSNTEVAALAQLLHETSEQHGAFEAIAPPHDWWDNGNDNSTDTNDNSANENGG